MTVQEPVTQSVSFLFHGIDLTFFSDSQPATFDLTDTADELPDIPDVDEHALSDISDVDLEVYDDNVETVKNRSNKGAVTPISVQDEPPTVTDTGDPVVKSSREESSEPVEISDDDDAGKLLKFSILFH